MNHGPGHPRETLARLRRAILLSDLLTGAGIGSADARLMDANDWNTLGKAARLRTPPRPKTQRVVMKLMEGRETARRQVEAEEANAEDREYADFLNPLSQHPPRSFYEFFGYEPKDAAIPLRAFAPVVSTLRRLPRQNRSQGDTDNARNPKLREFISG